MKYAILFISFGILAVTLAILFTPPFVVSSLSADHNISSPVSYDLIGIDLLSLLGDSIVNEWIHSNECEELSCNDSANIGFLSS